MNYHQRHVSNGISKKQKTVYLNSFEHKAMECLFLLFNNISDIVSSTQNALVLLQKSRKETRDIINNEFDNIISELTSQKMELLQSLSSTYQFKCRKLQNQLTLIRQHRENIKLNKKEFEKISINTLLNEYDREKYLIKLTNKQIKKIKKSLNGKKIIISSTLDLQCDKNDKNNNLKNKSKQCLNILNNTKIISFERKREFKEMYDDILQPLIRNTFSKNSTKSKIRKKPAIATPPSPTPLLLPSKSKSKTKSKSKINPKSKSKSKSKSKLNLIHVDVVDDDYKQSDTDSSSIIKEPISKSSSKSKTNICITSPFCPLIEWKKEENNDELKDMEEEDGMILNKIRGRYGELCSFSSKLKSFGIELTNQNKVAHKNHGNFKSDYILLDIENGIREKDKIKCYRFHHNTYCYALWGIVYKNNSNNKYDIKHLFGCNTENVYIRNGIYINNKIKTEQWSGKLVDMMIDLSRGKLKFCSPNFIEPKSTNKQENDKLNEIVTFKGISFRNKTWCPVLKLKHINTYVRVREIPYQWFGKYPKAVQFETFTNV